MDPKSSNPYCPPRDMPQGIPSMRRRLFVLGTILPITATGACLTSFLGMRPFSVTATLVPSAASFATCMWIVILTSKAPHPILSGSVIFIGSFASFASSSLYLDSVMTGWSFRDSESAFAAILGAAVFSSSICLSRASLRTKTATAISFLVFTAAAFAALVLFQHHLNSPHLNYVIFLCTAFFQSAIVGTIAAVVGLGAPSGKTHVATRAV